MTTMTEHWGTSPALLNMARQARHLGISARTFRSLPALPPATFATAPAARTHRVHVPKVRRFNALDPLDDVPIKPRPPPYTDRPNRHLHLQPEPPSQRERVRRRGFVAAPTFAGHRPGFVFKSSDYGVGYYRDRDVHRTIAAGAYPAIRQESCNLPPSTRIVRAFDWGRVLDDKVQQKQRVDTASAVRSEAAVSLWASRKMSGSEADIFKRKLRNREVRARGRTWESSLTPTPPARDGSYLSHRRLSPLVCSLGVVARAEKGDRAVPGVPEPKAGEPSGRAARVAHPIQPPSGVGAQIWLRDRDEVGQDERNPTEARPARECAGAAAGRQAGAEAGLHLEPRGGRSLER